jgi:hypothetical protein
MSQPATINNAWAIELGDRVVLEGLILKINAGILSFSKIQEGDPIITIQVNEGKRFISGFGRVFRKRCTPDMDRCYFDGFVSVSPVNHLEEFGMIRLKGMDTIARLEWSEFAILLEKICKLEWEAFPIMSGESRKEQAYIRQLMQDAIVDDLLGPAGGPQEEILDMSVRDRYLVGKLAPKNTLNEEDEELPGSGGNDDGEDSRDNSPAKQSLVPSSIGFTFCVDSGVEHVELTASWGKYIRTKGETINIKTGKIELVWKRIPAGGTVPIVLKTGKIESHIDSDNPDVVVQGSIGAPLVNGDRLVTVFLVNNQTLPKENQDEAWVFQPELIVRDSQGRPIFRRRPVLNSNASDVERESLEMIYRKQVEFAVGHGVSVHASTDFDDRENAVEIKTVVLPDYEIPTTETPGLENKDRAAMRKMTKDGYLDMQRLAELDRNELVAALKILTDDYALWISEQRHRVGKDVVGCDDVANTALVRCAQILKRLEEGIHVLNTDMNALEAFRFANSAMAQQRIRSIYALKKRRGEEVDLKDLGVPKNRSWRPFQLAFMLLSIPALADPTHKDRTDPIDAYADLLWFPTGGGKTEAYLGVAAFTMAIRRLQGEPGGFDGGRGLAVIMRYTLRLLTLQQFQRATTLICSMEILRRTNAEKWGSTPFSIGLWVGNRVTPGTTEDAHVAIQNIRQGRRPSSNTPAQLTTCPWCGCEIVEGRDIEVKRFNEGGSTHIYCGDKFSRCDFSKGLSPTGLPVLVVDDEIYRHPPTMLIATVDKFAMMAWRGQVRTLFGKATQECARHGLLWPDGECNGKHNAKGPLPRVDVKNIKPIRPPDLIIQDEFHLISGPLGTMVGLYETAIDELCTWNVGEKYIRPKVIASTATVRKAEEQVTNIFLRQVQIFPAHGLDVEDNFFSVQRSVTEKPGRRYLGICSPGSSRPAVLIRVYVAALTAAQALFEKFGQAADPYMTLVGYFNSLRELGGMKRLCEDDVQTRAFRVQMGLVSRPGLIQRSTKNIEELTSRVSSKDIPKKLDHMEVKFNTTFEKGRYVSKWNKGETRAIDIVLATNMLSVGVDVNRLGLMVVNGQPKNTAEYIQATSRVGRSFPGLVCTVLTWSRPRDLSHYETFEHYHASFYKHVEAQSVTPFAPRALDRGLTGSLVSLLRLKYDDLNPNMGAMEFDNVACQEIVSAKETISNRGWKATNKREVKDRMSAMISDRADRWVKEAGRTGRRLGYETESGQGDVAALLKKPSATAWDEFTVPMSMREVEPGVNLVMDDGKLKNIPEWK